MWNNILFFSLSEFFYKEHDVFLPALATKMPQMFVPNHILIAAHAGDATFGKIGQTLTGLRGKKQSPTS